MVGVQVTAPTMSSFTLTEVSVTLPVLVTTKLNGIVSPGFPMIPSWFASTIAPADLSMVMPGSSSASGVEVESGGDTTGGPVGGVPVAVAVLSTEPASTSDCLIT